MRNTEARKRNLEQLANFAERGHWSWRRRLRMYPNHVLDHWAAMDAAAELDAIHLNRWTTPETRAAIVAARTACRDAYAAMSDERERRGI